VVKAQSPKVTGYWDKSTHQGEYAEGLVAAIAVAAGLNLGTYKSDVGIDAIIAAPGPRGTLRGPKIEVQIKSWADPQESATAWRYPLKVDAYNDLAALGPHEVPRYLILCIVPDTAEGYARASHEGVRFHRAAYWHTLRDEALLEEPKDGSTKTVHVPKVQLLTPATLVALVEGREQEAIVL
jgi:hypothetical protein